MSCRFQYMLFLASPVAEYVYVHVAFMLSVFLLETCHPSSVGLNFQHLVQLTVQYNNRDLGSRLPSNQCFGTWDLWPWVRRLEVCPRGCALAGVSFSTLSLDVIYLKTTCLTRVLKVLSMPRRQGIPMRAHLPPDWSSHRLSLVRG